MQAFQDCPAESLSSAGKSHNLSHPAFLQAPPPDRAVTVKAVPARLLMIPSLHILKCRKNGKCRPARKSFVFLLNGFLKSAPV